MPAMKCPSCGHRHFQLVEECINCGEPMATPYDPQYDPQSPTEEVPVVESSSLHTDDEEITEYEHFLAESGQKSIGLRISTETSPASSSPDPLEHRSRSAGLRIPAEQQPEHASHNAQVGGGTTSQQLVRQQSDHQVANQDWSKQREIQPYEIYETALDIVPPKAFSSLPETYGSRSEQERQADPECWKTDKLPWYFLRTKPKIAGTVILIETKEEIVDYPDFFAAIATLLVEFIWILAQVQQERENDRVVMTTVRVQTYDGTLRDSRVRGNMRGANVSLGDRVSLWGMKRHGVLFVHRGFNHTTQGVISTHSLGLIVPALIVIVAFSAGIYFAPSWLPSASHQFMSSFGAFLNFIRTHQLTMPMQKKG
jgi:uncharacterized OB-fold protein